MVAIRISDTAAERVDALKPELAKLIGMPSITREQAVGFLLVEAMKNHAAPRSTESNNGK